MISVKRIKEPARFEADVRIPGTQWLAANPDAKRPSAFWSQCLSELRNGFSSLCGYAAMFVPTGTVDHYLSCRNHPQRAYEWSNYRFASSEMNNIKRAKDNKVLDPFEVKEGWFEILLPSLQMVLTATVPPALRNKAAYTLKHLKLQDDERVIRWRQSWYDLYLRGLPLEELRKKAPLIAAAVDKQIAAATLPRKKKPSTK